MARIELAHPCGYRILSPVRLPISPHEHWESYKTDTLIYELLTSDKGLSEIFFSLVPVL